MGLRWYHKFNTNYNCTLVDAPYYFNGGEAKVSLTGFASEPKVSINHNWVASDGPLSGFISDATDFANQAHDTIAELRKLWEMITGKAGLGKRPLNNGNEQNNPQYYVMPAIKSLQTFKGTKVETGSISFTYISYSRKGVDAVDDIKNKLSPFLPKIAKGDTAADNTLLTIKMTAPGDFSHINLTENILHIQNVQGSYVLSFKSGRKVALLIPQTVDIELSPTLINNGNGIVHASAALNFTFTTFRPYYPTDIGGALL